MNYKDHPMKKKNFSIIVSILILAPVFYSCLHQKNQSNIKRYYILYSSRGSGVDTLIYDSVNKFQPATVDHNIIDSFYFEYKRRYINIKKISNFPNAAVDGEFVSYWEKSIGYFYERSTTWRNFLILKTNNDSINDMVNVLLGTVLLDPQFSTNPAINYHELLDLAIHRGLDSTHMKITK